MTTPINTYNLHDSSLWIFGIGTMYLSKIEANKDKDQCVREYVKQYEFFGKVWHIRQSTNAIKTAQKMGYNSLN
jgi:hypothetical protein